MCEYYKRYPEYPKRVDTCNGKGFTRGADVTELIERFKEIENQILETYGDNEIKGYDDLIEVVEE